MSARVAIPILSLPSEKKSLGLLPCPFIQKTFSVRYMIGVDSDYQQRDTNTALINAGIVIIKQRGFALVIIKTGGDFGHAAARTTHEEMGFALYLVAKYLRRV